MKNRGIGTTIDFIILSLIICLSCLILVGSYSLQKKKTTRYPEIVSQNTLLALHHVKVEDIHKFSYSPDLPVKINKKCVIRKKTLTQLILDDIILNAKLKVENETFESELNQEYDSRVEDLLSDFLKEFTGERFGFKLNIKLKQANITDEIKIEFDKTIQNLSRESEKLCGETISIKPTFTRYFLEKISKTALDKDNLAREFSFSNFSKSTNEKLTSSNLNSNRTQLGTLIITLELWSN